MDNFVDKIAKRFTSTDMIRANQQADAAMIDSQKEQIAKFEEQLEKVDATLEQMRELNLKNIESARDVQNVAKTSSCRIGEAMERVENESVSKIKEASDLSIEGINRTSEVSIAGINKTVDESLAKIAEIKESKAALDELAQKIDKMQKEMEEYLHSDHVKIYRNMQTAMAEELVRQADEIKEKCKKSKATTAFSFITMLAVIAHLAFCLLRYYGIF